MKVPPEYLQVTLKSLLNSQFIKNRDTCIYDLLIENVLYDLFHVGTVFGETNHLSDNDFLFEQSSKLTLICNFMEDVHK
jgi:hypothetical protein